jgi:hypothetical protein
MNVSGGNILKVAAAIFFEFATIKKGNDLL